MYLLLLFPLLFWLPGSSYKITGPEEVSGLEWGSLTVQCHYDPGWEKYKKWWCRGAAWSPCNILVKTTGTEMEVKENRVSIRDNQRSRVFNVTMEKLRREDTDIYWCGIERSGADLGIQVKVTIGPVSTTTTTITSATNTSTVPVSSEDTTGSLTVTSHHSNDSGSQMKLRVLLPLLFALLLLLVVAASLLAWKMLKRQKKGERNCK
ncbi:CMRF35-like molecule 1 isoform X2 [Saccopteryx leptura]|uniref:CMRF35-like molecule 1 isoform X2 n=1 Tax=Saccopteryx leptura TaxID=249018 RepID=UPI00339CF3E7